MPNTHVRVAVRSCRLCASVWPCKSQQSIVGQSALVICRRMQRITLFTFCLQYIGFEFFDFAGEIWYFVFFAQVFSKHDLSWLQQWYRSRPSWLSINSEFQCLRKPCKWGLSWKAIMVSLTILLRLLERLKFLNNKIHGVFSSSNKIYHLP